MQAYRHMTCEHTCYSRACSQVFGRGAPFDYGFSLSDATDMPINIGIQFVPRGRYNSAIAFLQDVLAIYPFNSTFTAGQVCTTSTHLYVFQTLNNAAACGCVAKHHACIEKVL